MIPSGGKGVIPPLKRPSSEHEGHRLIRTTASGEKQSTTRSIDLARRLVQELSESAARTKEGHICIAKDELLTITNKRRLYDVTGPLEAMGLIETNKSSIIWAGPRIGSFSFIPRTACNINVSGKNAAMLAQYGKKYDYIIPSGSAGDHARSTSGLSKCCVVNAHPDLPRFPKEKKQKHSLEELREKLRCLMKVKRDLEEDIKQKEALFNELPAKRIPTTDIYKAVVSHFTLNESRLFNSSDYRQPFPQGYCAYPCALVVAGQDLCATMMESCSANAGDKTPSFDQTAERKVCTVFEARSPLDIRSISNQFLPISPAGQHTNDGIGGTNNLRSALTYGAPEAPYGYSSPAYDKNKDDSMSFFPNSDTGMADKESTGYADSNYAATKSPGAGDGMSGTVGYGSNWFLDYSYITGFTDMSDAYAGSFLDGYSDYEFAAGDMR